MKKVEMIAGDLKLIPIPLIPLGSSSPWKPAAFSLIFTIKEFESDPDSSAKCQKSYLKDGGGNIVEGGITIDSSSATWVASIDLNFYDTNALSAKGYFFDLQGQEAGKSPVTLEKGIILIEAGVTQEVVTSLPVKLIQPPFPGDGSQAGAGTFSAPALVAIGSGRLVNLTPSGVRLADGPTRISAHGFVRAAVNVGDIAIVETGGSLNGLSGLTQGSDYYLAANGLITSVAPSSGLSQKIGYASSSSILQAQFFNQLVQL